MWWVIWIIVAPVLVLFLLVILGVLMPLRVGFDIHAGGNSGSNWSGRATVGLRFFAGLLGPGMQAIGGGSEQLRITGGILLWKRYFPLRDLDGIADSALNGISQDSAAPPQAADLVTARHERPEREAGKELPSPERTESSRADQPGALHTPDRDARQKETRRRRSRQTPIREVVAELRGFWERVSPFVADARRRFRRSIRLRRFSLEGTIGTGDPAGTGWLLGGAYAFAGLAGFAPAVDLTGDFSQRTASGRWNMEWGVSLVRIWAAALSLAWIARKNSGSADRKKETERSKP